VKFPLLNMAYSDTYTPLNDDSYAPPIPKLSHQHIDNYGIYTIVCLDRLRSGKVAKRNYNFSPTGATYLGQDIYQIENFSNPENVRDGWLESLLAYQAVDIESIPINFQELIEITTPIGKYVTDIF
jgi:hypothetical protein